MKTKITASLLFFSFGLLAQEPAAIYGGDIILDLILRGGYLRET